MTDKRERWWSVDGTEDPPILVKSAWPPGPLWYLASEEQIEEYLANSEE